MNRIEAREQVNQMDITTLYSFKKSKGEFNYCCPVCGSGTGSNKTGALVIKPGRKIHCFANQCFGGQYGEDVLGALRILWGVSENEVFERVLGDKWQQSPSSFKAGLKAPIKPDAAGGQLSMDQAIDEWKEQNQSYIEFSSDVIMESEKALGYLGDRGITEESIKKFDLGYDEKENAIVLPYNKAHTYYELRYIDAGDKKHGFPKHKYKGVDIKISKPIFNIGAVQTKERNPVFVVESIFCAVSIMQSVPGTMAIAIGGTSGTGELVKQITERKATDLVYILCLDNDDGGKKAQKSLAEGLSKAGVKYIEYNIAGEQKDPNEALTSDEVGFIGKIYQALERANEEKEAQKKEYLMKHSNHEYLLSFMKRTKENTEKPWTSTGIESLDRIMDNGLYPGLYTIGAVSSLGKTTLCMQIMDNIAKFGRDVLIFSLEMARDELISRSVSRHTFIRMARKETGSWEENISKAKTCRGISDGSKYKYYDQEEISLISNSFVDYGRYTDRVFIFEGIGDIGVFEIRQTIENHIRITGNVPIVLVDYLQILAPYQNPQNPNKSYTDKQMVDKNVLELKRISRDFNLPVLAVSSLNRASYNETMTMQAFKESGAIEYSADVLIGLEYANIKTEKDLEKVVEKNAQKNEVGEPTKIKVKILKNRNGARGASCILDYFPMFNTFLPEGQEPEKEKPQQMQQTFTDVTGDIDVPF